MLTNNAKYVMKKNISLNLWQICCQTHPIIKFNMKHLIE